MLEAEPMSVTREIVVTEMESVIAGVVILLALALVAGCKNGEAVSPDSAVDGQIEAVVQDLAGESTVPRTGLPYADFYAQLQIDVLTYDAPGGDWELDFGDAAFYGPAFLVGAGLAYQRDDYLQLGLAGYEHDLAVLAHAQEDLGYFFSDLEEILMAALGVVEVASLTGDLSGLEVLDPLLDLINDVADGMGTYLETELESYALDTYGPTTITGVVALLNLRYAQLLNVPVSGSRLAHGLKVIDVVDEVAFNGSEYVFEPGIEKLYLYPNVSMMIANLTAHKLTGEERYLDRSLAAYEGIQPLKDSSMGCYRSPYSAVFMGAKTDEYITLSSQNFTIMALSLLFEATQDGKYRDEITSIAAFIHDYLYVDGKILHHWMDGRVAIPTDPEYFCTGCNLQFLFVSFYAETNVYGAR